MLFASISSSIVIVAMSIMMIIVTVITSGSITTSDCTSPVEATVIIG